MTQNTSSGARAELARAKVNLSLHVTGQRPDGYHLLDSLVAFPQVGDRLSLEPSESLELQIDGPFGRNLEGPPEKNLVLKAARAFAVVAGIPVPRVCVQLTKRLPVASGIGGGSSDAAAMLRLLEEFTGTFLPDDRLHELALSLGADVPVCLSQEPQIMRGIGDQVEPGPGLPRCGIVLVNPRVEVSTPEIFRSMTRRDNAAMPSIPESFDELDQLTDFLANCRNDLQEPAIGLCPEIGDVLSVLDSNNRVKLARMSGSGGTCFGLCEINDVMEVERELRTANGGWWIAAGPLA